jgi:hypothetical protein
LLTDATIHTVSGATIVRGDVLIQDGKIKGVFDASLPSRQIYPPDATKIDLKGLHLYPGMIALNTDLGLVEIDAVRATRDDRESGDDFGRADVQSWLAVNPDSEMLPVARANGVSHFEPCRWVAWCRASPAWWRLTAGRPSRWRSRNPSLCTFSGRTWT